MQLWRNIVKRPRCRRVKAQDDEFSGRRSIWTSAIWKIVHCCCEWTSALFFFFRGLTAGSMLHNYVCINNSAGTLSSAGSIHANMNNQLTLALQWRVTNGFMDGDHHGSELLAAAGLFSNMAPLLHAIHMLTGMIRSNETEEIIGT